MFYFPLIKGGWIGWKSSAWVRLCPRQEARRVSVCVHLLCLPLFKESSPGSGTPGHMALGPKRPAGMAASRSIYQAHVCFRVYPSGKDGSRCLLNLHSLVVRELFAAPLTPSILRPGKYLNSVILILKVLLSECSLPWSCLATWLTQEFLRIWLWRKFSVPHQVLTDSKGCFHSLLVFFQS